MAASKNLKITIDADSAAAFAAAIMKLGDAGKAAAAAMSGAAAGIKQMAQQAATMANMESGVVSRGEFKLLADKFARCSQRMSMILSLISPDELKRMGLLNADYQTSEIDGFDRVVILEALDRKVEQFNQAHQRLTGQRKRLQDPGRMELTQEEMAFVFALKSAGKSQKEVLRELEKRRKTTK